MVETHQKSIRIDTEGKVPLMDVVAQLRELQDEIQASLNQMKARRVNLTKQKLLSPNNVSNRPKPSHLKLVASNSCQQEELYPTQNSIQEKKKCPVLSVPELFFPQAHPGPEAPKSTALKEHVVEKPLPEMEELKEIINLLDKLED